MIHESGAGEVGAGEVFPFLGLLKKLQTGLGKFPVDIPREARGVVAVGGMNGGELQTVERMLVEPLLGGEARDVWEEESGSAEEWFVVFFGCLLVEEVDGPSGDLVIALVFVLVRKEAPVDEFVGRGSIFDEPFFGEGSAGGSGSCFMPLEVFALCLFAISSVEDLSGHRGVVAVVGEVLREGSVVLILGNLTEKGRESVDAGGVGTKTEHEGTAGGVAKGRLAMGVVEKGSALGERIDMGCF